MSSGGAHYCESNTDYNIATTNRLNATITNDAYDIADDHSGHSGDNSRQHTAEEDLLSNNTTLTNQTSNATNVSPSHLQASGGVRYSDPTIANLSLFATNGGHQEGDGDEDGNSDQPHEENISTSTRRRQVLLFHHPADRAHYLPGDAATPAAATAVVGESQQHQEDDASYDSDTNFTLTEGLDLLTGSTVNNDGGGGRHSARNRSSVSSKAGGRVAGGVRISPTTAATAANNRKTQRDGHKIGDHSPSSSLARKQKAVTVNRDENDRSAAAEEVMSSGRHDSYYHDAEDDESTRGTDGGLSSLTQFIHRTLYENPTATNADDSLYEDPDATGNESTTTGSATAATMTDEYPNSDADDNEGADGDEANAYTSRKRERDEKGKEKGESVVASGTTNRNKSDLVGSFDRAETESTQFEVPLKFGDVDDDEEEDEEELPSFSADEDEDEDSEQQQHNRSTKPADVTTIGTNNKNIKLKKEKGKRNGRGRRELLALAHEDRHVGDDADGGGSGTDSSSSSSSSSSTSSSSSDSSQEESLQQQKKRHQQRGAAGDCYVGAKGDDVADSYFSTYSDLDVHKLMLSDGPRMKFYSAVLADSREKSKATVALGAEEEHNEIKNKKEGNALYGDGFHGFTPTLPHQVSSSSSSSATADKTASTVDRGDVGGGIVRGSVVVEVGCGSGVLSVWAAKYGRARRVIAFEGSTEMATLAAAVAVENGLAVGTAKVNPHDETDADFIVRQLYEDDDEDDTKHEEKNNNSPSSSSSSSSSCSSDESSSDNDEHEEVEADTLTQFDPDNKRFGRSHFAFNSKILPELIVVDGISDVVVDQGVDAFIHRFLKNEKHTGIRAHNSDFHDNISDEVPYLPVSVVYSEWMGFYLLHECMLPSVIRMRIFLESVNAEVERRNNDWLLREREESPSSSASTPTVVRVRNVRYGPPAMVPNKATLYVSPVSLQPFYQDRYASFWGCVTSRPNPQLLLNALAGFSGTVGAINCSSSSNNGDATSASLLAAHRLKMLSIARLQFESLLETVETSGTPLVELLPHSSLLCRPKVFADIDLQNCSVAAALECVGSAVFDFSEAYPPCAEAYPRSAHVDGFCVWFDVSQETDPTQPSFAAKALATTTVPSSSASETTTTTISPPVLPTGPTDSPTHWKQSTLLIPSSMRAEIAATAPTVAGRKGQFAAPHQSTDKSNEKKEKEKKKKKQLQEKGKENVGDEATIPIHPLSLCALVASRERMKVVISIKRTKGRQYAVDFELEDASNDE